MPHPSIHWHEGLFLRPHHFQYFQRQIEDLVHSERSLAWAYPYGVIEAKLSNDDLENFRLRFDSLKVVMPGGAVLSFPENTEVPSLDIRNAFSSNPKGFTVYLGLPLWVKDRSNVIDDENIGGSRVKIRQRVARETPEVPDENTGGNHQPIQVRRFNAMLLLDGDDDDDLDKIPLLRITHDASREEPFPRRDPNFIHPCLLLSASATLREMVRDITAQILSVREQLANVVARGSESSTIGKLQLEQTLRLRSLNAFSAKMPSLLEAGDGAARIAPLAIYLELRALLAELMALFPERGDFNITPYRHDDPYSSFQAVIAQIRNYLHGAVAPDYLKIEFEAAEDDIQYLTLEDKHLSEPNAWFLGIRTDLEPSRLVELVEDTDQFKLMPRSYMERAIRGVVLKEERFPPLELPAETGRYYFRLQTTQSHRIWDEVTREKEMVARWSLTNEVADLKLTLFMTLPQGSASSRKD